MFRILTDEVKQIMVNYNLSKVSSINYKGKYMLALSNVFVINKPRVKFISLTLPSTALHNGKKFLIRSEDGYEAIADPSAKEPVLDLLKITRDVVNSFST